MGTFTLVKMREDLPPYWYQDVGDWWVGSRGFVPKGTNNVVLETVTRARWKDLDHLKTGLIEPNSIIGWLSPDATFYGCSWLELETVAELCFKNRGEDLIGEGWITIGCPKVPGIPNVEPNESQRRWIKEHSRYIQDSDQCAGYQT